MDKLFMLPRLLMHGKEALWRLATAWLVSAAFLLLGVLLALVVGLAHYARGLLVLALVLAGWMRVVEWGLAQALAPAKPTQPAPATGWLLSWYCGVCFTQGLGLAIGCLVWLKIRHG